MSARVWLLGLMLATTAACEADRVQPSPPTPRKDAAGPADAAPIAGDAGAPDAKLFDDAGLGALDAAPDAPDAEDAVDAAPAALDAAPDAVDAAPDALDAAPDADASNPDEPRPDAGSAAPDASPSAADAEPAPDAAAPAACSALHFDGLLGHARIDDDPSLDATASMTLEAWIRPETGVVNPPWYPNIISKRSTNAIYPAWALGLWADQSVYTVANGAWANGSTPVMYAQWTHVAVVYSAAQVQFYVNGVPAGSAAANTLGPPNREPAYLGTLTNNTQNYRGDMAGLRISSVARYTGPFSPARRWSPDADTVVLLPMDEGQGPLARDTSSHGHDAALQGLTWIAACP